MDRVKLGGLLVALCLLTGCDAAPVELTSDEIEAAFLQHTQAAQRTVKIDIRGDMTWRGMAAGRVALTGSFEFHGDDYAGSMRTTTTGGAMAVPNQQTDVIVVNGQAFTRMTGMGGVARWERSGDAIPSLDLLRGMTAADVRYGGPEGEDGSGLHRIEVLDPAALVARSWLGNSMLGQRPAPARVDVVVNDQGYPVAVHVLADMREAGGDDALGTVFTLRFDYSNWGAEVHIEPPL